MKMQANFLRSPMSLLKSSTSFLNSSASLLRWSTSLLPLPASLLCLSGVFTSRSTGALPRQRRLFAGDLVVQFSNNLKYSRCIYLETEALDSKKDTASSWSCSRIPAQARRVE